MAPECLRGRESEGKTPSIQSPLKTILFTHKNKSEAPRVAPSSDPVPPPLRPACVHTELDGVAREAPQQPCEVGVPPPLPPGHRVRAAPESAPDCGPPPRPSPGCPPGRRHRPETFTRPGAPADGSCLFIKARAAIPRGPRTWVQSQTSISRPGAGTATCPALRRHGHRGEGTLMAFLPRTQRKRNRKASRPGQRPPAASPSDGSWWSPGAWRELSPGSRKGRRGLRTGSCPPGSRRSSCCTASAAPP